jgi:hypothetical protein
MSSALIVISRAEDVSELSEVLPEMSWQLTDVSNLDDASAKLNAPALPAIFYDRDAAGDCSAQGRISARRGRACVEELSFRRS